MFDEVRMRHALLYPEGVLLVNETAGAVLERCDGSVGVPELLLDLQRSYHGVTETDVLRLLSTLDELRLLEVDHG
jgi:coenzyme PQQ biosynthesis protein PqqD